MVQSIPYTLVHFGFINTTPGCGAKKENRKGKPNSLKETNLCLIDLHGYPDLWLIGIPFNWENIHFNATIYFRSTRVDKIGAIADSTMIPFPFQNAVKIGSLVWLEVS